MKSQDNRTDRRTDLVKLLQTAYSAEMGAALAYRGHWHSLKKPSERAEVRHIEAEEWLHRREIGNLLRDLLEHPRWTYEIKFFLIGTTLRGLCHLAGYFLPMYGAGRLESQNFREYAQAAALAFESGHSEYINCLLSMSETEWDHEAYFRGKAESHPLHAFVPMWEQTPPKASIREPFRFLNKTGNTERTEKVA